MVIENYYAEIHELVEDRLTLLSNVGDAMWKDTAALTIRNSVQFVLKVT